MDKEKIYQKIVDYLKNKGALKVAIFGSYSRDEEKPNSDIDVLVTFNESKSLLELVRIERKLSKKIGIKVDLLTEKSLHPYVKQDVLQQMKVVYG